MRRLRPAQCGTDRGEDDLLKYVNGLAVLAALASGALWIWASTVHFNTGWGGMSERDQEQHAKQRRLNGFAALASGLSGLLQAINLWLSYAA
jgi:hypothetical protein